MLVVDVVKWSMSVILTFFPRLREDNLGKGVTPRAWYERLTRFLEKNGYSQGS